MQNKRADSKSLDLTLKYLGERFNNNTVSCGDVQDMAIFEKSLTRIAAFRARNTSKPGPTSADFKNNFYFKIENFSNSSTVIGIKVTYTPKSLGFKQALADSEINPLSFIEDAFRILMGFFKVLKPRKPMSVLV